MAGNSLGDRQRVHVGAFLALAPILFTFWTAPIFLLYLHTPAYMVHQVEEHARDRFRLFVNRNLFDGLPVVRAIEVIVINIPLVWGVNLASLYIAVLAWPGASLVAPYAMLINGVAHIAMAAKLGIYNPGIVTSIVIFLPLSLATLFVITAQAGASLLSHAIGAALAVLFHLLIAAEALMRRRKLMTRVSG